MNDVMCDTNLMDPAMDPALDPAMDCGCDAYDQYSQPELIDLDGDGVVDAAMFDEGYGTEIIADLDGDGFADTYMADSDGNGIIDVHIVDQNGDGIAEYEAYGEDPMADPFLDDNEFDSSEVDATVADTSVADTSDYDTIDAAEPFEMTDGIHGDPMAEITYHQAQPGPVDCVPTSIAMVLSEMTGEFVPADEVVALANELDVMTETGMSAENGAMLLEQYGVEAEVSSGTLDDLRAELDQGTEIIIGLDSADLYSHGGGPFDVGMEAGHAVVITGIDDDAGLVYINDPGFPDGAGVAIPIEDFEDAWEDSENLMIEVHPADDSDGFLGALLLPLQFVIGG